MSKFIKKNFSRGTNAGFTLIELLVVVLIIGILASVALPQYNKAVVKARFAEAFTNLKSIAQAHQACYLGKGSACSFDELDLELGETGRSAGIATPTGDKGVRFTKHFHYAPLCYDGMGNLVWAVAQYVPEDVCLCLYQDGRIVLSQDHEEASCSGTAASFDYAKLLNVPDAGYSGCSCC